MSKKSKLQAILNKLSPDRTAEGFKAFDDATSELKKKLKESVEIATLNEVNVELNKFRKKINLDPIISAIDTIKENFETRTEEIGTILDEKTTELSELLQETNSTSTSRAETLTKEIEGLKGEFSASKEQYAKDYEKVAEKIAEVIVKAQGINADSEIKFNKSIGKLQKNFADERATDNEAREKSLNELKKLVEKVRMELVSMIASKGGGSMNRKITFGGTDYLTRYTDINYKAGSNVSFSVSQNNQTKMVDVTIAATGTGGTTRSINSVSTDTAAGDTAGTDYVYLCTGTLTITLPTAVGNTNLYTIKNVGSGVVTVATTSSQTIDGDTTITMPVQFTAVDLISDTANWNIT